MTFDFRDKRPDKHSDRARWNESWEHDLESTYTGIGLRGVPPRQMTAQDRQYLSMLGSPSNLYTERASREIVELQQDLSEFAVKKIAVDDFRTKWKALPSGRREDLVLEALFQASIASPDMEGYRRWCPEMTITFLAGQGGEGFLTLLVEFIQDTITMPILVPHVHVEQIFETEPYSLTAKHGRLHRAYFISLVLWCVLLAFYGLEEGYITGKNRNQSYAIARNAAKVLGEDEAQVMRQFRRDFRTVHKGDVDCCFKCGKDARQLEIGQVLRACAASDLVTWGSECQKQDWKNGRPTTHKAICGKPFNDNPPIPAAGTQPEPKNGDNERIPPPDPGFKRSPALVHQISFLRQPPFVDYVFVFPSPKDDMGLTIPDLETRFLFLTMRQRALKNGDPSAVAMMFRLLSPFALTKRFQIPVADLKKQLSDEYNITSDIDLNNHKAPGQPTHDEINLIVRMIGSRT